MRSTTRIALMIALAAATAACNKPNAQNNVIDNNAGPPTVEALPPDESSETSSNELVNGTDNSDVSDLNNSGNAY
jgi:hypothetical protein